MVVAFARTPPQRNDTDGLAVKPRAIAGNSFKICGTHRTRRGGDGREKELEMVRLRSSASHVPREAELKF
jgi:hypothetical protein